MVNAGGPAGLGEVCTGFFGELAGVVGFDGGCFGSGLAVPGA
jgi:hypothetical protein